MGTLLSLRANLRLQHIPEIPAACQPLVDEIKSVWSKILDTKSKFLGAKRQLGKGRRTSPLLQRLSQKLAELEDELRHQQVLLNNCLAHHCVPLSVRSSCAPFLKRRTISLRSMMTSPRLIHISDLHFFNPDNDSTVTSDGLRYDDNACRSAILTSFLTANRDLLARPGQSPVLIITGDLTDCGDIEDYEFAKQFITNLMSNGFEVYVTPGNHDYCKYGAFCLTLDPEKRRSRFIAEIEAVESNTQTADQIPPLEYPKFADSDNGRVILLDSVQDELDERDAPRRRGGQGRLGVLQLNAMKVLIDTYQEERAKGKKLAVCLHHAPLPSINNDPMWNGILEDHALLIQYISGVNGQEVIDCLLFGHAGDPIGHAPDVRCGYPSDEGSLQIPLINSENLEYVGWNSSENYRVTVLDLGTYQRLVFWTSDNPLVRLEPDVSWSNFAA